MTEILLQFRNCSWRKIPSEDSDEKELIEVLPGAVHALAKYV